jgi:hypothetical protein
VKLDERVEEPAFEEIIGFASFCSGQEAAIELVPRRLTQMEPEELATVLNPDSPDDFGQPKHCRAEFAII